MLKRLFIILFCTFFLIGCKKAKMKSFPTIIEVNSSQLAPNTTTSDLKLVFGSREDFDANTTDKLYNEFGNSYFGQYFESIEGDHWNKHGLGSAYHENAITKEGDVFSIKIYWKHIHSFNEGEMKAWKDEMKFILLNENLGPNTPDYLYDNLTSPILMKKEGEIEVNIEPKNMYKWDLSDNSFTETGEKPKKTKTYYDPDSAGSGAANNSNENGGANDPSSSSDCQNWQTTYGGCLDVNGTAGIQWRQCRISETTNSVTYKVEFQKLNEGIDPSYYPQVDLIVEGQTVAQLSPASFNQSGYSTTETTISWFDEGVYPLIVDVYCAP